MLSGNKKWASTAGAGPLAQWTWRADYWAKENCSWALRSSGTCSTGFWACMVQSLLSYFLILHFGMGMSVLCLFYHCVLEAGNLFDFPGSLREQFASRWIISWVLPIWFRGCLDKTLDIDFFKLTLEWLKTLGAIKREWLYCTCMNLVGRGGVGGRMLWSECLCPPQVYMLKPNSQCDWRVYRWGSLGDD